MCIRKSSSQPTQLREEICARRYAAAAFMGLVQRTLQNRRTCIEAILQNCFFLVPLNNSCLHTLVFRLVAHPELALQILRSPIPFTEPLVDLVTVDL